MKKTLIALLSVTVVLVFTVSAFALHAVPEMFEYTPSVVKSKKAMIELGGQIRIRGFFITDADFDDETGDNRANYDQRVRLNLKATVSPNTLGFIELETGNDGSADTYTWGNCSSAATGLYGQGNCKPDDMFIRQAYIAHQGTGLLGRLSGFKAGHMLLALGNGLFFDHSKFGDDAIVLWTSMGNGTEVSLTTIKFSERTNTFSDDANAYVITGETSMNGINLSGDITWVNDKDVTGAAMASGGAPGTIKNKTDLWNLGLRGDTNMQGINIYGDIELQTGEIERFYTDSAGALGDLDLSGWALLIGADMNVGNFTVTGEFAYGSGDEIDSSTSAGVDGGDDYEGFITSLSSGEHYTYLYDDKVRTAAQALGTSTTTGGAAGITDSGLTNTWYLNLGASTRVNPDVKVSGDIYYLQAAEDVAIMGATKADGSAEMDDELGWELDGKIEYQIDTNLVYYIEGGILFAGDAYRVGTSTAGSNKDPDDPYSVRHGIILKF